MSECNVWIDRFRASLRDEEYDDRWCMLSFGFTHETMPLYFLGNTLSAHLDKVAMERVPIMQGHKTRLHDITSHAIG